jgi:hypothetical protein
MTTMTTASESAPVPDWPIDTTDMARIAMYVALTSSDGIPSGLSLLSIFRAPDGALVLKCEVTESTYNWETREWDRCTLSIQTERVDATTTMLELHDLAGELQRRASAEAGNGGDR